MTGEQRLPWEALLDRAGIIVVVLDREGKILGVNGAGARLLGASSQELIGRDWFAEFVPPQREPEVRRVFAATLKGATAHVNIVRSLTGAERTILWHNAPLPEPGTGVMALGIDITDRMRLAEELEAALKDSRRRLHRLAALREIDKSIIASRSLEETAQLALEAIPPELGADAVALTLLEGPECRPVLFDMRLPNGTVIREEAFQLTDSLLEALIERKETVAVPDLEADPRVQVHLERIRSEGLRSYLGVPLVAQGRVVGVLHALSKSKQLLHHEDVEFFRTLAGQVAIALESTRLADELARSEREYRELFDMAPVGIYRATLEGRLIQANRALAELLGYSSQEALLEAVTGVLELYVDPVRRDEFLQQLLVSEEVKRFETQLRQADGGQRWVSKHARLIRDSAGRPLSYVAACDDITDRVVAREREERSRRLLELQVRLAQLVDADAATLHREALRCALELTGSELGFLGRVEEDGQVLTVVAWSEEVLPACRVEEKTLRFPVPAGGLWAEPLRTGRPIIVNDYAHHPGRRGLPRGHAPITRFLAVPIETASRTSALIGVANKPTDYDEEDAKQLKAFFTSVQVLLERREMEEELARFQEELRHQEHLKLVGQLASGVAHDINNALSPVLGYVDLLLQGEEGLSDRGREFLARIKQASEAIADTVQRLRNLYRVPEEGMEATTVDLSRMAHEAVELARPRWKDQAQAAGWRLRVVEELHPRPLPVRANVGELRDAVLNLVVNALEAMPQGGTLTVRTGREPGRAVVEVVDTGVGMDDATLAKAREPFFTTKGAGTGLGLAVADRVARSFGGELSIQSEPGKGTCVRLAFPLAQGISERPEERALPVSPLRVLVVDDEPRVRGLLEAILAFDGHVVEVATKGEEALASLRRARDAGRPFDLVLTDFGMPGMDGGELARRVKQESPTTPVVLLTGWGSSPPGGSVPPQVDRVLAKPPRVAELRRALSELAGGDR